MKDAILNVLGFPMYAVGWMAGMVVRALAWCRDCVVVGYHEGRGR